RITLGWDGDAELREHVRRRVSALVMAVGHIEWRHTTPLRVCEELDRSGDRAGLSFLDPAVPCLLRIRGRVLHLPRLERRVVDDGLVEIEDHRRWKRR